MTPWRSSSDSPPSDARPTGLKGGVPIIVDGHCIGGIGAGSATGDQDREIALAGLAAIAGAQTEF